MTKKRKDAHYRETLKSLRPHLVDGDKVYDLRKELTRGQKAYITRLANEKARLDASKTDLPSSYDTQEVPESWLRDKNFRKATGTQRSRFRTNKVVKSKNTEYVKRGDNVYRKYESPRYGEELTGFVAFDQFPLTTEVKRNLRLEIRENEFDTGAEIATYSLLSVTNGGYALETATSLDRILDAAVYYYNKYKDAEKWLSGIAINYLGEFE